ncbi:hypothetical protein EMPG_14687 [Blastomyces silverae]|uniref:Uncharacterized protein n=1 Tax=Blastomyces silverae TaxID=2060906 RepID=A0A0H1BEL5_9EURO|nr:hypothetical protein EMPG_14687 [Blastomyces silverae]
MGANLLALKTISVPVAADTSDLPYHAPLAPPGNIEAPPPLTSRLQSVIGSELYAWNHSAAFVPEQCVSQERASGADENSGENNEDGCIIPYYPNLSLTVLS